MEKELRRCLSVLTTGNPEEVRDVKAEIEKLWHKDREAFKSTAPIALEYLPMFDQIKNPKNQAAFASGLSLFFLVLGDEYFDTLADFTLKAFQHPNGTIRQAILNTAEWLYVSLTARVNPFVYPKGIELTEKQKSMQKQAKIQYINLVKEIELLIDKYDEGDEKVRYIQDMKPSINKSLQLFWSRLAESVTYKKIVEQSRPVPFEIAVKRRQIENELLDMLKKAGSNFSLKDIKEIIYNEDGQDGLTNIITMFDTGQRILELQNILAIVNDAWNYFPHKILGGLSPAEKALEYQLMQQKVHRV